MENNTGVMNTGRLFIKNLPKTLDEKSLKKEFEKYGAITDCRIIFNKEKNRQIGFIGFKNLASAEEAMKNLNNSYIMGRKVNIEFATLKTMTVASNEETGKISNRLYVYNFPFDIGEEDLREEFQRFGTVTESKILRKDNVSQGRGFISFEDDNSAILAIQKMNNTVHFGRILHVKPSQEKIETVDKAKEKEAQVELEKSSFKKLQRKRMFESVANPSTWNSVFLNPNSIIVNICKKLNISKDDLLDKEIDNFAAIQSVAEQQILNECREFLDKNGLNTSFWNTSIKDCPRSNSAFFIKNLSSDVDRASLESLLSNYGRLGLLLMPDNKCFAIAKYFDDQNAKNSFEILNNSKFKGSSLLLEWVPENLLNNDILSKRGDIADTHLENELNIDDIVSEKTVFIKNLNYTTKEDQIENLCHLAKIKDHVKITIVRLNGKSQGYGFIEFSSKESAVLFIKKYQDHLLDSHSIKLSISKKRQVASKAAPLDQQNSQTEKLIVKNVAFQATKAELKELFKEIIDFNKLRMPKKIDGSHRGYAFLEFTSIEKSKKALETISDLHFYGRKLVVEYTNN